LRKAGAEVARRHDVEEIDHMKFGLSTLTHNVFATPDNYVAVAQAAEKAGFDFLSVSDHVIVPSSFQSHYPYVVGGAFGAAQHGHCFDQLATIAFLAGVTGRLRLLTSVMVLPHRPAVVTAKTLATIDVLSKGRLIVGVGAGWFKEEIEQLGVDFAVRGRISDETLAAFKELWTKDRPRLDGRHVKFDNIVFEPKPVQKPHPPIWVGGESKGAIARAVRYGDVWYPGNNSQTMPLDTADRFAKGVAHMRGVASAAGRDPASIGLGLLVQNFFEWGEYKTQDGSARRMLTGTSANMIEDAAALSAAGLGHACLRLGGATLAETIGRIERFGAEVITPMRKA
jgi:probable F420-dependent oxidoreductase